jgi:SAM-dependent methyltransferase
MSDETPHRKYLAVAAGTVGLRGHSVLEVGGCSPPSILREHAPRKWTAVNMHPPSVTEFNEQARSLSLTEYSATLQDIAAWQPNEVYDRIYSINSFEHISNLAGAFETMYRSLRPGGYLFTLFGPIWSSDVGHHLSLSTDKGPVHFSDGLLDPWEHLTSTPEQIHAKIEKVYDTRVAERAVEFIYRYPDINRKFEHEYLAVVANSGLAPVMVIRNRKGRPPNVPGATSTREFVMVLKKGRAGLWERATLPIRFGLSYLKHRSD